MRATKRNSYFMHVFFSRRKVVEPHCSSILNYKFVVSSTFKVQVPFRALQNALLDHSSSGSLTKVYYCYGDPLCLTESPQNAE